MIAVDARIVRILSREVNTRVNAVLDRLEPVDTSADDLLEAAYALKVPEAVFLPGTLQEYRLAVSDLLAVVKEIERMV